MVYVDDVGIMWKGQPRYHMTADSLDELHDFAARVGIARCWFHKGSRHPHYDVTGPQREDALGAGATAVDKRALARVARGLARVARGLQK